MTAEPRHATNRRLLRARDRMDRSYADALDIEALARSIHLSRDAPVTEICFAVGFTSLGTFSRTFRDIVGGVAERVPRARAGGPAGGDPCRRAGVLRAPLGSSIEHFRRSRTGATGLAWRP